MTAKEALEQGFSIDRTCYPNMIYKGPRFNPVEVGFVLTDLEQELLEALRNRDEMFKLLLKACNDFIKKRIKMSDFKEFVRQVNQTMAVQEK